MRRSAFAAGRVRARRAAQLSGPRGAAATADRPTLMVPHRSVSATRAGDPMDPAFAGQRASTGSADRNWLHDRLVAVPRIRRLVEDEPLAASGVEQKLTLMFGTSITFASSPDPAAFRLPPDSPALARLARSIELAWRRWAQDPQCRCDWEGELDFDLMVDLAGRHRQVEGESLCLVNALPADEAWPYQTALQVVDPDRLRNPMGLPDGMGTSARIQDAGVDYDVPVERAISGVGRDERGRRIAYHVLDGHPEGVGEFGRSMRGNWYPRWDPLIPGRSRVLHVYRQKRAGQTRGISPFVSVMSRLQSLSDLNEAELRSRVLNALVFANVTSSMDAEYIREMFAEGGADELLDTREAFYKEAGIRVGGTRVIQTFPGDELKINQAQRDTNAFADTITAVAMQSGAGLGLTSELLTRDFSRTTFSSARTSQNDATRSLSRERALDEKKLAAPLLFCVLQEAFERGELDLPPGAPHILDEPGAYLAGKWLGSRKDYVDPVKEAMGDRLRLENGVIAPSDLAAEHGQDFERLIARIKRDKAKLEQAGITLGDLQAMAAINAAHGSSDGPAN